MSSVGKVLISLLILPLTAIVTCAADPEPSKEQIAQWILDLGSENFTARDQASQRLWKAGRLAEDALKMAVENKDAEVRTRARDILDKFKWGLYPDTPKEIVELIQSYQGSTPEDKQKVIKELYDRGNQGCAALVKIAQAEEDPAFRKELFVHISQEASRAVPVLLAEGNFSKLDELMELSLSLQTNDLVVQNYAAYWLLRDKLDERIALFKARSEKEEDATTLQILSFLYRAKGDRAAVAKIAEKAGRLDVLQAVLAEARDWKALSRLVEKEEQIDESDTLGMRAAFHRLAGNSDAYDKALVELRAQADAGPENELFWRSCKGLLINVGPGEVIDRVAKSEKAPLGFDLLITQLKIKEALEYAEKAGAEREQQILMQLHKARALAQLGETDKARDVFTPYGKQLEQDKTLAWADDLIQSEARAGFRAQALEHLTLVLSARPLEEDPKRLLGLVFPQQKEQAAVLWKALRYVRGDDKPTELMAKLSAVLAGKVDAAELQTLLEDAARQARNFQPHETESWLLVLGETALEAGLDDLGEKYLEQAARTALSSAGYLKLGDHHASKKHWERAAEAYGQAHTKDPKMPSPVWLQGWALTQAGQVKEGKKLMELAHWLPLGDEQSRHGFCKELLKRSGREAREALQREVTLAERTGRPNSYYAGEVVRLAGMVALEKKDFLEAADLQERSLLRLLSPYTEFLENPAYVTVPHFVHSLRARGLVAAGRIADARREIEYCQGLVPGNVDLPIHVAPELAKRGEKKLADEVFTKALVANEKVCAEYPKSAGHRNNLAWMCACCQRELDKGLEHATEAVKLVPDNAGYTDTLAEVHFQRGNKDRAIEVMKKCIAMEPKRAYYRKQLKRFETGDRNAEVPPANEDDD